MTKQILDLTLDEFGYKGMINLPVWNEFTSDSDDVYEVNFGGDINSPLLSELRDTYDFIVSNQEEIKNVILQELFEEYSGFQAKYCDDEDDEFMPDLTCVNDLKPLISLARVHILDVIKDGIAYIGFEFDCPWDEEHGFGVMLFKNKVVAMGGSDSSFLSWIANDHLNESSDSK